MSYKRATENTGRGVFNGAGKWDIPTISPIDISQISTRLCVGYNLANTILSRPESIDICLNSSECGLHFFLEDYIFESLWRDPDKYLEKLKKFKYICAPDFSLYTDHPKAIQLYSHYKKHWLSAYYAFNNIKVVPTICWSDEDSYEWCFDGEPKNSVVAISTKGTQRNDLAKKRFYSGYNEMMKRLTPSAILLFGNNPGSLSGNVIEMGYELKVMK